MPTINLPMNIRKSLVNPTATTPSKGSVAELLAQIEKLKTQVAALSTATKALTKGDVPADHPAEQFTPGTPGFQELLNAAVAAATARQSRRRSAYQRLTMPEVGTAQVPATTPPAGVYPDKLIEMFRARDAHLARSAGIARALGGAVTYVTSEDREKSRALSRNTLTAKSARSMPGNTPKQPARKADNTAPVRKSGFRV